MTAVRGHEDGTLHSRSIEKRMAAANKIRARRFDFTSLIMTQGFSSGLSTSSTTGDTEEHRVTLLVSGTEPASESHDVVAAVDVNHFSRDAAAGIRRKEYSGRTDFLDFHTAA